MAFRYDAIACSFSPCSSRITPIPRCASANFSSLARCLLPALQSRSPLGPAADGQTPFARATLAGRAQTRPRAFRWPAPPRCSSSTVSGRSRGNRNTAAASTGGSPMGNGPQICSVRSLLPPAARPPPLDSKYPTTTTPRPTRTPSASGRNRRGRSASLGCCCSAEGAGLGGLRCPFSHPRQEPFEKGVGSRESDHREACIPQAETGGGLETPTTSIVNRQRPSDKPAGRFVGGIRSRQDGNPHNVPAKSITTPEERVDNADTSCSIVIRLDVSVKWRISA